MKVKAINNFIINQTGKGNLINGKIYEVHSVSDRGDAYFIFDGTEHKKGSTRPSGTGLWGKQSFVISDGYESDLQKNISYIDISKLILLLTHNKISCPNIINGNENKIDIKNKIFNIIYTLFNKTDIKNELNIINLIDEDILNKELMLLDIFIYIVKYYGDIGLMQLVLEICYGDFEKLLKMLEQYDISNNEYRNHIISFLYSAGTKNDIIHLNLRYKKEFQEKGVNTDNLNVEKISKYFSDKLPNSLQLKISDFVRIINKNTQNNGKGLDFSFEDNKFFSNYFSLNSFLYQDYKLIFEEILTKNTKFIILHEIISLFDISHNFLNNIDYSNKINYNGTLNNDFEKNSLDKDISIYNNQTGQINNNEYHINDKKSKNNSLLYKNENMENNQIVLTKDEFLKRLKENNITFNKLKEKNFFVKSFYEGNESQISIFNHNDLLNNFKDNEFKNYFQFYLLCQNLKNNEVQKDLYVVFNAVGFAGKYNLNIQEASDITNLIKNYLYNEYTLDYSVDNTIHNLSEIFFREGNDDTLLMKELTKSLSLTKHSDIKNKFKINTKVKLDQYGYGDYIFTTISSMKFDKYKNNWTYKTLHSESYFTDDIITELTDDEINNYFG